MWALLLLCIILFLAFMVWRGQDLGFIRMILGVLIIVASIFITTLLNPLITGFIKDNFSIYDKIYDQIYDYVRENSDEALDKAVGKVQQRREISSIAIPESLQKVLIENNNIEVYNALKVKNFSEYVCSYLATLIIKIICFAVTIIITVVILNIV